MLFPSASHLLFLFLLALLLGGALSFTPPLLEISSKLRNIEERQVGGKCQYQASPLHKSNSILTICAVAVDIVGTAMDISNAIYNMIEDVKNNQHELESRFTQIAVPHFQSLCPTQKIS
jgi:hypothetical protein